MPTRIGGKNYGVKSACVARVLVLLAAKLEGVSVTVGKSCSGNTIRKSFVVPTNAAGVDDSRLLQNLLNTACDKCPQCNWTLRG